MNDPGPIPPALDRTSLIGTFTMLNCYDSICAHQAWHRYVLKDVPYQETPAIAWGNKVHAAFEQRIAWGKPLPLDMAQWEPFATPLDGRSIKAEQKLGLTAEGKACGFFDKSVRFRVKVDAALVNGANAFLIDWKTGSSKYEDPFELEIGAMHLHALHPGLTKIVGQYVWLKENRLGQLHDLSETNRTWDKANKLLARMDAARKSGDWPKRESPLCAYCPVDDCEFNRAPK